MKYYIWLQLCLGQGKRAVAKLIEKRIFPKTVYDSDKEKLKELGVFTKSELEKIDKSKLDDAVKISDYCTLHNIKIVTYTDAAYPECLKEIYNPPLLLYIKGEFPDFDNIPSIAIVGPRKVSEYGKKAAYSLGYRLGKSGITIVSGGALGTDTYAHTGALKSGGKTVLIMGCGFDTGYLKENSDLRKCISNNGCLMSEYPPETPATKFTFPVRNRLISALSLGTVVVEAPRKSGALLTANYAAEHGKDVYVIPGSPEKEEYKGSNALFRDGAKPLLELSDIWNDFIVKFPDKINIEKAYEKENLQKNKKISNETLSNEAKIVYNCLDKQKFYPDELDTGLNSSQLLSALTELEMEFLIRALPGGQYEICK